MVPGAKLVGGVWLPETEKHFVDMMLHNPKRMRVIDGKHTYQYHKIEAALSFCKSRRTYVDVGAHVGLWAMWIHQHFDLTVAFEPVPLHADIFPHNVNAGETVVLYRIALGDSPGIVELETASDETGSCHIAIGNNDMRRGHDKLLTYRNIEVRTLDSFALQEVDLIKIDVEGWELPVVRGAQKTIEISKPIIVVEQKGNDQFYGFKRNSAVEFLRGLGMRQLQIISGDYIMGW
jgi:FkbM family methyltransferase